MQPPSLAAIAAFLVFAGWQAWSYGRLPIGMDVGLWLLWGFTGSRPYLDHVDCKPPGVHVWGWVLARVTGRRLVGAQVLHHLTVATLALLAAWRVGSLETALVFLAVAQSSAMQANLSWLEVGSAALFLNGLTSSPEVALLWFAAAGAWNLKLVPPALAVLALRGGWAPLAIAVAAVVMVVAAVRLLPFPVVRKLWYGTIVVPHRMAHDRRQRGQPWWPRAGDIPPTAWLLAGVAVVAALRARPEPWLWVSAGLYLAVNAAGRVWRPYHLVPLASFAAVAAPDVGLALLAGDWLAHRAYTGDVVGSSRSRASERMHDARTVGQRLKGRPGRLWVADLYTQIYVYAAKRPGSGWVEQVEIREAAAKEHPIRRDPPPESDLIAYGPSSVAGRPSSYRTLFVRGPFYVLERLPCRTGGDTC